MQAEQAERPEQAKGEHRAVFDDGRAALRFTALTRPGAPFASGAHVPEGCTLSAAARAAVGQLPGWLLQTEDFGLAAALIKAGARPVRHAFAMQSDLRCYPRPQPAPPGLHAVPLDADCSDEEWADVLPSWHAAFPPDHPDHFRGDDAAAIEALRLLVSGAEIGPMHASSTLVRDDAGSVVAGIIITVNSADPPWNGPWVGDLWRDPSIRGTGVGGWLLGQAQHHLADDGFVSLGLAVSASNPARRTYEAAGFRVVAETQTVQLPADAPTVTFPA